MIRTHFFDKLVTGFRLFLHPRSPAAVYRNPKPFFLHLYARLANLWICFQGGNQVCLICGRDGRFGMTASISSSRLSKNSLCFGCGSNHRTRTLLYFLKDRLPEGHLRILDIGPGRGSGLFFKGCACDYLTLDKYGEATFADDITDMKSVQDQSLDAVLCSHVLHHIREDIRAMSEIRRILKDGGKAYIVQNIDPDVQTTQKAKDPTFMGYGFEWHYGRDFQARLEGAGFRVESVEISQIASSEFIRRYGLCDGTIFVCQRQ